MHDTARLLEQQPEVLLWLWLPGQRVPHMRGTEHTCMYRISAVRQQRRAETPLPGLHNLGLHILALPQRCTLARSKRRSLEHPVALRRRTGNQGGLHTGNADALFLARNAGGTCAPNGHGGEERAADVWDDQVHDALVWQAFLRQFAA